MTWSMVFTISLFPHFLPERKRVLVNLVGAVTRLVSNKISGSGVFFSKASAIPLLLLRGGVPTN